MYPSALYFSPDKSTRVGCCGAAHAPSSVGSTAGWGVPACASIESGYPGRLSRAAIQGGYPGQVSGANVPAHACLISCKPCACVRRRGGPLPSPPKNSVTFMCSHSSPLPKHGPSFSVTLPPALSSTAVIFQDPSVSNGAASPHRVCRHRPPGPAARAECALRTNSWRVSWRGRMPRAAALLCPRPACMPIRRTHRGVRTALG